MKDSVVFALTRLEDLIDSALDGRCCDAAVLADRSREAAKATRSETTSG